MASEPAKLAGECAEEAAAQWFARLHADDCRDEEVHRFMAWLEDDTENRAAYEDLCAIWDEAGSFADSPEITEFRLAALSAEPSGMRFWPSGAMAIAASLALVVALALFMMPGNGPAPSQDAEFAEAAPVAADKAGPDVTEADEVAEEAQPVELATTFGTRIGERSTFSLPDGSTLELNTNSLVRVTYTKGRRALTLERGEAFFKVAHDSDRPFVVRSSDNVVTALGTAFSVRLDGAKVTVTLLEGKVKVERFGAGAASTSATPVQVTSLVPGQQLAASANGRFHVSNANVVQAASWREGRLIFEDQRLSDVLAEVNRYTTRKLVIGDADISGLRISGTLWTDSADTFVPSLEAAFPVVIRQDADSGKYVVYPAP
ncbi:MAG: FecR domain-containing protein [Blastomonas sp.]